MPDVYLRLRLIPWVPPCVAQHTRLLIDGNEHYFVKCGPPRHHEASRSDLLIRDVLIGDAPDAEIARAIEEVDRHFPPGSYTLFSHDCSRYAFLVCAALFDEETLACTFPRECNNFQRVCRHGFDYVDTTSGAGYLEPLARGRAIDPFRAALACRASQDHLARALQHCHGTGTPGFRTGVRAVAPDALNALAWASVARAARLAARLRWMTVVAVPLI
jgi:hypothetical protein